MGVYIPNMEMPTSCPCELLGIGYDLYCSFVAGIPARVKEYYECCQNDTRPSWCPLSPVQPHGRLIDADAVAKMVLGSVNQEDAQGFMFTKIICQILKDAPTIIPAEEGE